MPGTLYLVATPIGNLEDITLRAIRILQEADLIACEDTRQTRKLLDHYRIQTKLISYHEHNERQRAGELLEKLEAGEDIALVSDAGTPLVSDPGYHIVRQAAGAGITIVPIPGPSAALAALAASGLSSGSFLFVGFLPPKGRRRREILARIRSLDQTAILYEAPHRVLATLGDLEETVGERPVVAAREMTKLHEEFLRGTAGSIRQTLAERPAVKGEFTIVVGKADSPPSDAADEDKILAAVRELVAGGASKMEAIKSVARELRIPKRQVYETVEKDDHS